MSHENKLEAGSTISHNVHIMCIIYDLSWYGNANQIQNAIKHIITSVLSEYWKEIMGHPYVFKICQ